MTLKVIILLKYFLYVKYSTTEWKAEHIVYFPSREIVHSECPTDIKVKKSQNRLSILFCACLVSIILIRMI
jgi:hypothetical protein